MASRHREEDSNGTAVAQVYTLFVDTSLGTRMATNISASATVSEIKSKIALEHTQMFPQMGEIKILSLQVKRWGCLYSLSDSMVLVSAYAKTNLHKSLFVEASISKRNKEQGSQPPLESILRDKRINADNNEGAITQIENDRSKAIEVEKGLSSNCDLEQKLSTCFKLANDGEAEVANEEINLSDSLMLGETMEAFYSVGPKRKKRKKKKIEESSAEIQGKAKFDGEIFVSVAQSEGKKAIQNEEVLLTPTDVHLNEETIADMDEKEKENEREVVKNNERRDDSTGGNEKLVTGQPGDVQGSLLDQLGKHQDNDSSVSRGRRTKRKKGHLSAGENLSNLEMKEQSSSVEELVPSWTLALEVGTKTFKSMDVSDMDENVREPENPVTEQPVQGQLGKCEENDSSVNRKRRKKKKKGHIPAERNISNLEVKEQISSVEELVSSGTLMQEVGGKQSESIDASVSVAQRECQNQELLLPTAGGHPDADIDENAREVIENYQSGDDGRGANGTLVTEQPNDVQDPVVDQLGRHQENGSSVNRREEKKRKKGQTSAAENLLNSKLEELAELAASAEVLEGVNSPSKSAKIKRSTKGESAVQSSDPQFQIEKNSGIEKSNLETSKGADEGINFRTYFLRSAVNGEETSESAKLNKSEDKINAITESTLKMSETLGKRKTYYAANANDKKHEESTNDQNKELPANKNISKASKDGAVPPTSRDVAGSRSVEKSSHSGDNRTAPPRSEYRNGSSTAPRSSLIYEGPREVQGASIAKKQVSFDHTAMANGKFSDAKLLKNSGGKKSLLTKGRKLFPRSESSSDSDSSSSSTSDSSLDSSSSSTGESDSSLDSSSSSTDSSEDPTRKGPKNTKTKGGAGKSVSGPKNTKTKSGAGKSVSGPKDTKTKGGTGSSTASTKTSDEFMSMEKLLKSSSRFKKAKLTASQSQDDEDWPADVVPDSQPKV